MTKDTESIMIGNLVEKITKGVRKQLRGCTTAIKEDLQSEYAMIQYKLQDWKMSLHTVELIRKDFYAVELMMKENAEYKKLYHEMRELHQQARDELIDLRLTHIKIKQDMELMKINSGTIT